MRQVNWIIAVASAVQDRNLGGWSRRRSNGRSKPGGGPVEGGFMAEIDIFGSNGKGADHVTSQAPQNGNHTANIAANSRERQRREIFELLHVFEIPDGELVDFVWTSPRLRELWRKFVFSGSGKVRARIRNEKLGALERHKSAQHAAKVRWARVNGNANGAGGEL